MVTSVNIKPKNVKRGHKITITMALMYGATVDIFLRTAHNDVGTSAITGFHKPGTLSISIKLADKITHAHKHTLVIRAVAHETCAKQIKDTKTRFH